VVAWNWLTACRRRAAVPLRGRSSSADVTTARYCNGRRAEAAGLPLCMEGSTDRLAAAFPQMLVTSEPIARRWTGAFRPLQQPRLVSAPSPAHAGRACATSWCWREPGNDQRRAILLRRCGRVELVRVTECSTPSCRRAARSSTSASICSSRSWSMVAERGGRGSSSPAATRRNHLIWQTAKDNLRAEAVYERAWAPCARSGSTTRWRSEGRLTRAPAGA
jgi:hypothetical protein